MSSKEKRMTSNKENIRIYTDEELQLRNKGLREVKQILEKSDTDCILIFGVLLGAVREKNFIKWDWDVELAVFSDSFLPKFDSLEKEAIKQGFVVDRVNISNKFFKAHLRKYDTKYSLTGVDLDGRMRRTRVYQVPCKFFETLDSIEFLGEIYKTPSDVEGYLEYTYGKNWKTPLMTYDKTVYKSDKTTIKTPIIYKLYNKLKQIILLPYFQK